MKTILSLIFLFFYLNAPAQELKIYQKFGTRYVFHDGEIINHSRAMELVAPESEEYLKLRKSKSYKRLSYFGGMLLGGGFLAASLSQFLFKRKVDKRLLFCWGWIHRN